MRVGMPPGRYVFVDSLPSLDPQFYIDIVTGQGLAGVIFKVGDSTDTSDGYTGTDKLHLCRWSPMTCPLDGLWSITSQFNIIAHPPGGIDMAPDGGAASTIRAANTGIIYFAGLDPRSDPSKGGSPTVGYGNTVVIVGTDGLTTVYGHFATLAVSTGQPVTAGDVLGTAGTTGHSTGVHLHFEVRDGDIQLDPRLFLTQGLLRDNAIAMQAAGVSIGLWMFVGAYCQQFPQLDANGAGEIARSISADFTVIEMRDGWTGDGFDITSTPCSAAFTFLMSLFYAQDPTRVPCAIASFALPDEHPGVPWAAIARLMSQGSFKDDLNIWMPEFGAAEMAIDPVAAWPKCLDQYTKVRVLPSPAGSHYQLLFPTSTMVSPIPFPTDIELCPVIRLRPCVSVTEVQALSNYASVDTTLEPDPLSYPEQRLCYAPGQQGFLAYDDVLSCGQPLGGLPALPSVPLTSRIRAIIMPMPMPIPVLGQDWSVTVNIDLSDAPDVDPSWTVQASAGASFNGADWPTELDVVWANMPLTLHWTPTVAGVYYGEIAVKAVPPLGFGGYGAAVPITLIAVDPAQQAPNQFPSPAGVNSPWPMGLGVGPATSPWPHSILPVDNVIIGGVLGSISSPTWSPWPPMGISSAPGGVPYSNPPRIHYTGTGGSELCNNNVKMGSYIINAAVINAMYLAAFNAGLGSEDETRSAAAMLIAVAMVESSGDPDARYCRLREIPGAPLTICETLAEVILSTANLTFGGKDYYWGYGAGQTRLSDGGIPEDSVGLFQLNRNGGQGDGHTVSELQDIPTNVAIGGAALLAAWVLPACQALGTGSSATGARARCAAANSGHPDAQIFADIFDAIVADIRSNVTDPALMPYEFVLCS